MRENSSAISGVFYNKHNKNVVNDNFRLRRYFPNTHLAPFIEQFWFVDWHLPNEQKHTQKNLPDPNPNLLFKNSEAYVVGPVDGRFEYEMQGLGSIVGVKFHVGVLPLLDIPFFEGHNASDMVNKQYSVEIIFDVVGQALLKLEKNIAQQKSALQIGTNGLKCIDINDDRLIIEKLEMVLCRLFVSTQLVETKAQHILEKIKHKAIYKVDTLADIMNMSVRQLQRICKEHIGLSPKCLIRKYRMHEVLKLIDDGEATIVDVASMLDYTDQSHLIRDFLAFVGQTPKSYKKYD